MRLYKENVIKHRIIARKGNKVKSITVIDTNLEDALILLKKIFSKSTVKANPINKPVATQINVQKLKGNKSIRSKSFSIYGYEPNEAIFIITSHLK